jgi:glutathione S-transferase
MWIFAKYVSEPIAAALGAVFIVGRAMYFVGYTQAANKRSWGYAVSSLPMLALLLGSIVGPLIKWLGV